ncbi:heterokaryon incompatibility protein-domain-containing protein [Trametes meyenii]|nr:heterokaryon incompatibility protein-domain-containing protein [Trametes meyenii]
MWLLNTRTAELRGFPNSKDVRYAIVSHVWQQQPKEQTFHDVRAILARCKESGEDPFTLLSRKIRDCCRMAARAGYDWLWLDTCCIDHHSSAELSEAINSMFSWYTDAQVCYAYLHDVDDDEDPSAEGSAFRRSIWHTRGWTLQELLAPACVIFLSRHWNTLGSKYTLAVALSEVSGIRREVLTRERYDWLEGASVAERMSWAAHRKTTRLEDGAYSLMGIFGINMPTIYGEGPRAFMRLQEEILQRIPDQSIFAWGRIHGNFLSAVDEMNEQRTVDGDPPLGADHTMMPMSTMEDLLAPSPLEFAGSAGIQSISIQVMASKYGVMVGRVPQYTLTSHGMLVELPVSSSFVDTGKPPGSPFDPDETQASRPVSIAILGCTDENAALIVLLIRPTRRAVSPQYAVGEYIRAPVDGTRTYYRAASFPGFSLTAQTRKQDENDKVPGKLVFSQFTLKQLYIRHDYATITLGQARLRREVGNETDRAVYAFHVPQWALNRLETRHSLKIRPACEDGLTLRVPYRLDRGRVEHAVSSIQVLDATRKELLTLRIGVGCACPDTSQAAFRTAAEGSDPQRSVLARFWVDARVAPVAEPGYAQSYGVPLDLESGCAPPAPCGQGRLHIPGTVIEGIKGQAREGEGPSGPFVVIFRAAGRNIQVSIEPRKGFEPVHDTLGGSYSVTLDVLKAGEDRDLGEEESQNTGAVAGFIRDLSGVAAAG